jgi:Glyoxalase/Bleomycin resistance protein/Dioxygenase superfamily
MAIKGARADNGRITPHLMVRGGRKAIEFYTRAFGATVLYEAAMPHGDGLHAHLQIGKTMIMITDEQPPGPILWGSDGLGGRSVRPRLGDFDGQRRSDARTGLRAHDAPYKQS